MIKMSLTLVKRFGSLIILLMFCSGTVFSQGVNFLDISLDEALSKAKAQNKLIFIDCYTTWCGPCRNMSNKIFPQKECGDFFNSKFISLKYDVENNPEGIKVAKLYGAPAFPTFIVLNDTGEMLCRLVGGYAVAHDFVENIKFAICPSHNVKTLESRYNSGLLSMAEILEYKRILDLAKDIDKSTQVMKDLKSQFLSEQRVTAAYWPIIEEEKDIEFVKQNVDALRKNVGVDKVNSFISLYYNNFFKIVINRQTIMPRWPNKDSLMCDVVNFHLGDEKNLLSKCEIYGAVISGIERTQAFAIAIKALKNAIPFFSDEDKLEYLSAIKTIKDGDLTFRMGNPYFAPNNENYQNYILVKNATLSTIENDKIKQDYIAKSMVCERILYCGVWFTKVDNLDEAFNIAKKESKWVFVECVKPQCSECNRMDKELFITPEAGSFINMRFVSVKMDISKSGHPEMKSQYNIPDAPSYLIFSSNGKLFHKIIGGVSTWDEFQKEILKCYEQ